MIIRYKNRSIQTNNFESLHPYEPIDDWSKSLDILTEPEQMYDTYFYKIFSKLSRCNEQLIIENMTDSIEIMKYIKYKINNINMIPQIIIKLPKEIKPSVILLKYFTIIT